MIYKPTLMGLLFALCAYFMLSATAVSAQTKTVPVPVDVQLAEVKNDVVISISGFDALKKSVVGLAGKIDSTFGMLAADMFKNQPALQGITKKGPIGVVADINPSAKRGDDLLGNSLGFLPVTEKTFDAAGFIETLNAMMKSRDDSVFTLKMQGENAIFTLPTTKIKVPVDPAVLLGGLPDRYLLAAQVNTAKFVSMLESLTDSQAHLMLPVDGGGESLLAMLKQVETALVGANINAKTHALSLDVLLQLKTDVDAAPKKVKTKLAGFYDPEASIGVHAALVLPENIVELVQESMASDKETAESLRVAILQAVGGGKMDFAFSGYVGGELKKGILAFSIQDGAAVKKALQKAVKDPDDDSFSSGKFDVDEAMPGLKIHTFEADGGATIAIALTKTYLFLAFNYDDNIAVLKEKIPATFKAAAPRSDFQAHFAGELSENVENASGVVRIKGYLALDSILVKTAVTPDFIRTTYQDIMLGRAAAQAAMDQQYKDFYDEYDREFSGETPEDDSLEVEFNFSPEFEAVEEAMGEIFGIVSGYAVAGNDITLSFNESVSQKTIDATVEKIKAKLPKAKIKIEISTGDDDD